MKICGITRAQDAALAADLGASAIGFVFWPGSPRYISPEAAREIVRLNASPVKTVGVFVDASVEHLVEVMDAVGLDAAQLHGHESAEYCRQVMSRLSASAEATARPRRSASREGGKKDRAVIKAIGLQDTDKMMLNEFDSDVLILVDAHDPSLRGGTGRTVNWDSARQIAAARKTILAGGLTPENVGRAVDSVKPYGVDVSSGVESAPGVKDADRLNRFFEALNE